MSPNDDIIYEYPSVYDEYKDEDWYLWFGSHDCSNDEEIDEEDYVPIQKMPKNPKLLFVQVCAVSGKQAERIRSPLDRSEFWICDPRLIYARSDRWDFQLESSTGSKTKRAWLCWQHKQATMCFERFDRTTAGPKTISARNPKSSFMDTKTMKYESSDVVEDIEPLSVITEYSDGTSTHYLDTNGTVERQMKKPKVEVRLPEGFLDPIIQQFWKAGDYESCGNNSEMLIPPEVVRPIRNSEASKPAEYAQYDATPEAYASTSRKSPFKASTSSKVLKASTNSIPSKAQTLNANGYASVGHEVGILEELRKDNHELKQRVGSTEIEMINSLLRDLLSERDKNALLEKQVQKAEEKIKKLDEEHEAIIGIFSVERSRQYDMEASLRKKCQVGSAMILTN